MQFLKNTLTIVVLSVTSYSAFAETAPVEVYGKANVSIGMSDTGDGSFSEVKSHASRLGFKGDYQLNDDLQVLYKLEWETDVDGDTGSKTSFEPRNQYVGLKGSFGEVLLGKNDTILKQSQGGVDVFNDDDGDIKKLFKGENRLNSTLTYKSPKFNGFQVGGTYITEGSADGTDGISLAVFYGDKSLKKSSVFASVALDSDVNGYDIVRASVQGKLGDVVLGGMIQSQEQVSSGDKMDGYLVSAKYNLEAFELEKVTVKGQIQMADFDGGDSRTGISVGADYNFNKATKVYAYYMSFDMDSKNDESYSSVGIEYKF